MTLFNTDNQMELDEEWVDLILRARAKGLTIEEVSKALRVLQEEGKDRLQESAV
ncbi:DNA-binding anti-repressor SinI [Paenibacillus sp. L3-i20]|uniref:DNA-binding anti-repressor SinI n=1 Tax=Paenibacillus sp. L3-i20 TaxID=2905833 RepID=UPI001EDF185E|nr:DNA-binding anti-repressor SinI [Paenibacillus sp. L3-i20]GKU75826.1 hypothetical protein L3i20_v202230 [Paenibacillus sp. L3-i20]